MSQPEPAGEGLEVGPDQRYRPPPCEPPTELRFRFEIKAVGGEQAQKMREAQARAIKELLEWIHQQRTGET